MAQKECNTYLQSIISRKRGAEWKKLCTLLRTTLFSQQNDTKIVNFDEGVLILWPFSEAMSFWRFALLSQKSHFTYRKFSIVWLPRVKCLFLLCKAKPAWIRRNIHYVALQHYNAGELLKEISPYLKRDFWYKRSKFWKWHCLRKNGSRIKTPSSVFINLSVILLGKECSTH